MFDYNVRKSCCATSIKKIIIAWFDVEAARISTILENLLNIL